MYLMAALAWLLVVLTPTLGLAQVTIEQGASVLVFPKVVADDTRDTTIQLTNRSNGTVNAHCYYVDGTPSVPGTPPGPLNPPSWQQIDFDIVLSQQQPTHWVASLGRRDDPADTVCGPEGAFDCDGAGLDPGLVPELPGGFRGELLCIELDATGQPLAGNHHSGVATPTHRL